MKGLGLEVEASSDLFYLFVVFVVPGFIALKVYALLFPSETEGKKDQLIDAATYGCINFAAVFSIVHLLKLMPHVPANWTKSEGLTLILLMLFPLAMAFISQAMRHSDAFQNLFPHPVGKPWDFFFRERGHYWVMVNLKNGEQIAGKYGDNSFSSSAPHSEQIYLEQQWHINKNGGFDRPYSQSAGVLILGSEILSIEFFSDYVLNDEGNTSE